MDKYLNLILESNGKSLEIGEYSNCKIVEIEGLESSDYEINITKNTKYSGGYVSNKRVEPREISITGEFSRIEDAESERQKLIAFFNPNHTGILTVNYCGVERAIEYEIDSFKDKRTNLYDPLMFKVDLICPDPYFKDIEESLEKIATWIGGWKFKFKLPFKFKQRGDTKRNVYSDGHVETPLEIEFKGPAINPSVSNLTTGEFIKVNRTLTSDDTLYISTGYGNKKVEIEINGVRENAFNYIDLDSTFFKLIPGDNLIEYKSEDDTLKPQRVEVFYKNRYLGV